VRGELGIGVICARNTSAKAADVCDAINACCV